MSENVYPVPTDVASHALIDNDAYLSMYKQSVEDPEGFWGEHGKRVDWIKPFTIVKNTSFDYHNVSIKWYEDGQLNVAANCIDRHLETRGDQTAIIWKVTTLQMTSISLTNSCMSASASWPMPSRKWVLAKATALFSICR